MYKVVIVDDESLIVEGIKMCIDWEQHGFQIIGQALNGLDALELICRTEPDLVFTDIRMPGLSGLELMKMVSETHPDIHFVVVSGYAEFAFAQKALKHGAIGYCLKPFEEEEISIVLKKAASILEKEGRNDIAPLALELLESLSENSQLKIPDLLKKAGLDMDKTTDIMVIATIGQGKLSFAQNTQYITLRLGLNKKVYLLKHLNEGLFPSFLEKQLAVGIDGIGVVEAVKCINDLKNSINEAVTAAYQFFILGRKGVFSPNSADTQEFNKYLKNLDRAIQQKDTFLVQESFKCIRDIFGTGCLNIRHAYKAYNLIMAFIFKYSEEEVITDMEDYGHLADSFKDLYDLLEVLRELVIKHCFGLQDNNTEEIGNTDVKQILDYISGNFYKPITIISLSKKFSISPNYLSNIFKKAVGENFKEYLAKIRIEYACELLKNSEYTIQQIGEKTGYSDCFHFSRIFKSVKGLSPSRYRSVISEGKKDKV